MDDYGEQLERDIARVKEKIANAIKPFEDELKLLEAMLTTFRKKHARSESPDSEFTGKDAKEVLLKVLGEQENSGKWKQRKAIEKIMISRGYGKDMQSKGKIAGSLKMAFRMNTELGNLTRTGTGRDVGMDEWIGLPHWGTYIPQDDPDKSDE